MNRLSAIAAFVLLVAAPVTAMGEERAEGKVIEFDESGNEKRADGAELKKDEISQAESCRLRFSAQCATLKRCGVSQEVFPCDALLAQCGSLVGKAPYPRKAAEACAAALGKMSCQQKIDFTNPASLDPAARVPACRQVIEAERKQAGKQNGGMQKGRFSPSDFSPSDFGASDFSPSDFSPSDFTGGF